MLFGKTSASEPSRFVREISRDNIAVHESVRDFFDYGQRFIPEETSKLRRKPEIRQTVFASTTQDSRPPVLPEYRAGDTIEHTAFGRGVIVNLEAVGGDALLEIKFKEHGAKRLMLKFASRYMKKV